MRLFRSQRWLIQRSRYGGGRWFDRRRADQPNGGRWPARTGGERAESAPVIPTPGWATQIHRSIRFRIARKVFGVAGDGVHSSQRAAGFRTGIAKLLAIR